MGVTRSPMSASKALAVFFEAEGSVTAGGAEASPFGQLLPLSFSTRGTRKQPLQGPVLGMITLLGLSSSVAKWSSALPHAQLASSCS
jgi:hypothetical protein